MTSIIPIHADELQALYDHPGLSHQAFIDKQWSEAIQPPASAFDLASDAIFVICNSGMKHTVAREIYHRVMAALEEGRMSASVFGHVGKASAIIYIWQNRRGLLEEFRALKTDDERLAWCGGLPWIGPITKYHLAKNLGVDCAKPDVHLQRLADLHGETVDGLCGRLAEEIGWRKATVDVILWRACAEGVLNSRTGELRAA